MGGFQKEVRSGSRGAGLAGQGRAFPGNPSRRRLGTDVPLLPPSVPRDKYQVFDSAPRGLLRVEELEDQGQTLANVFILRLLENADDREATYMLKASSQ